jgi:hypothetical protein
MNRRVIVMHQRKCLQLAVKVAAGMLLSYSMSAQADGIVVRPQAGIGMLDGKQYEHAGLRLLTGVTDIRRYGLELTRVNTAGQDYVAMGIVLEQRLFGWFNMSIGTIGYFGQGVAANKSPGLVSNLGWEPVTSDSLKPFITFRTDIVFGDRTLAGSALSAGFSYTY